MDNYSYKQLTNATTSGDIIIPKGMNNLPWSSTGSPVTTIIPTGAMLTSLSSNYTYTIGTNTNTTGLVNPYINPYSFVGTFCCVVCKKTEEKCRCFQKELKQGYKALQFIMCHDKLHKIGINPKGRIQLFNHGKNEHLGLVLAQLEQSKIPPCFQYFFNLQDLLQRKPSKFYVYYNRLFSAFLYRLNCIPVSQPYWYGGPNNGNWTTTYTYTGHPFTGTTGTATYTNSGNTL